MDRISDIKGFSLVEMLLTIGIFSIILAAVSVAYVAQVRHTTREFTLSESEVELQLARNILKRDIEAAGYGLAEDYDFDNDGDQDFNPVPIGATNANPDSLSLTGTALGAGNRASQHWTHIQTGAPTFRFWGDVREDPDAGERVILINPSTRELIGQGSDWRFVYTNATTNLTSDPGSNALTTINVGDLLYGIQTTGNAATDQPYATVSYSLSNAGVPANCAPNTNNLVRTETWKTDASVVSTEVLLNCVLDFQVAFGLDTDEDGVVDAWDNGGATAAGYDLVALKQRLKQVRVYLLVQAGRQDPGFTFSSGTVRVGDSALGIGRDVTLNSNQTNYRWRVVGLSVTPRNLR